MTTCKLTVELPADVVARLGPPEEVAAKAKEAFVLYLLRQAQVGQSKAAELLGITRADLLALMVQHQVLSGLAVGEDADRELETARGLASADGAA